MQSLGHQQYQDTIREWIKKYGGQPGVAESLYFYRDVMLVFWRLDLEPARPALERCWAKNPRGGCPWDPVVKLRALLLAVLVGQPSLNKWADDLAGNRILRLFAGIEQDRKRMLRDGRVPAKLPLRPGVGTFYDFLHHLHDGPVRRTCEHIERPSESERRRALTPRVLHRKADRPRKPSRRRGRPRRGEERPREATLSVTARIVEELDHTREQANPMDLLQRLSEILIEVAVLPSGERGLLGDITDMVIGGDGSMLRTGAATKGKRVCGHPFNERCSCPRLYSDPDAQWGWNAHRKTWFFGHHFYELSTSVAGHDLPLALGLVPGNGSDFTASLGVLDRFHKNLADRTDGWRIGTWVADAGHDAEPIYRYVIDHGATPVIPLKADAPATHPARQDLRLSKRGVPLCKAGIEMSPWGSAGKDRSVFICPVRIWKIGRCPLAPKGQPNWHCRPELAWGPTVSVKISSNPRLCPPISRNSRRFRELYNLRSGTERSNSMKKEAFRLESARHRRSSFWLIRLHLIAILQHAKAWVANEGAKGLVDELLGQGKENLAA
jgi:hypothetical protein